MKKITMKILEISIFIIIALALTTSCVKHNNCDCGMEGKFIYFEEKKIYEPPEGGMPTHIKVNALFTSYEGYYYAILDNIPKKYRSSDTINNVSVCIEYGGNSNFTAYRPYYKLKCIEKIE